MIAYKFLRAGRAGPFSGFAWPEPGVWVRAGTELTPCRQGVHACRGRDLPWWLADELWEIELDGEVQIADHKILASGGRLRSRIDGWTAACRQEYADACARRACDRAVEALIRAGHREAADRLAGCGSLDDLLLALRDLATKMPDSRNALTVVGDGVDSALSGVAAVSSYIAAHAATRLGGTAGYSAERAWQAQWLVERLGLRADA